MHNPFRARTLAGGTALLFAASLGLAAPASAAVPPPNAPSTLSTPSTAGPTGGPLLPPVQAGSAKGSAAEAQCEYDFRVRGVNIRSLPNTDSNIRGQGNKGDCLVYHQATTSQKVDCPEFGYDTDQWFDVTDLRTGARGWVLGCSIAAA